MNQITSSTLEQVLDSTDGDSSGTWEAFTSAHSDESFCRAWLTLQCAMIEGVGAGLLLLRNPLEEAYVPAAVWPNPNVDLSYMSGVAEQALSEGRGTVLGLVPGEVPGVASGMVHVAYPLQTGGTVMGVVAIDLQARAESDLQEVMRQLLWGTGWLEAMFRRVQGAEEVQALERAAIGLDLVQVAQEQGSLNEAALALVNNIATALTADRVSLGIEKAGKLKLRAISRTAWFDRKSQLVEGIENAMEEAIDQEGSVIYPAPEQGSTRVLVAQRDLALRSGAEAVMTVPLTITGETVGAITLERNRGPAFDQATILLCEVAGEILGPALQAKLEQERWFTGRAVEKVALWRDKLLGPRRPTFKLGVLMFVLLALFLAFAKGDFRITARTVIEGQMQRAAVAPFDGYIASAEVRAGDTVIKGQVLAELDDREIKLERARWQSEKEQATGKYREALAQRDATASRIFAAQRSQAEAQLALADEKLVRTQIIAPLDSVVVWGDLSQTIGAPVERGKVLFELAPLGAYRVILQVDDRDIAHISVGQPGELALAGLSGKTLPFSVKSVTSVSTPKDGRNYFRVEAEIEDLSAELQPGMEGIGKVSVERRGLVWIWTRNFVSWLRIALWNWLP
jgi:multidrug resistance efflux pump